MKDTGAGKGLAGRTAVPALHPVSCILYLPSVMTLDTSELNKTRHDFNGRDSVWLFGYGSL
ncbi:MAG TPA: hypothetical protein DD977_00700, partial [Alcanivorax sp.]|nr:hypothetical protein [Alcanivorax sp.]